MMCCQTFNRMLVRRGYKDGLGRSVSLRELSVDVLAEVLTTTRSLVVMLRRSILIQQSSGPLLELVLNGVIGGTHQVLRGSNPTCPFF